jgi:hypothetical protein
MKINEIEFMRLYKEALKLLDEVESNLHAACFAHEKAVASPKAA